MPVVIIIVAIIAWIIIRKRKATNPTKKRRMLVVLGILAISEIIVFCILSAEEAIEEDISQERKIDSITTVLLDEDDSAAIDTALDFRANYEKMQSAYAKDEKSLTNLQKKKQSEKTDKQIAELKQQMEATQRLLEEDAEEYVQYVNFLNHIDTSFYLNHKKEIKEHYLAHINGTATHTADTEDTEVYYMIICIDLIATVVIIALLIILFIRSDNKTTIKIAQLLCKQGDISAIDKAIDAIEKYEDKQQKLKALEASKNRAFSAKKKQELEVQMSALKGELEHQQVKQEYAEHKTLLSFLSQDQILFYKSHKDKVYAQVSKLDAEARQRMQMGQIETQNKMQEEMERQQKDSEARDIKDELEDKKSVVARAISELKGKTNMLQTEVDKSGSLAREFLHSIAENLERIERNKSVLEDADKTALKRNHKILADTFKRAKNASEFSVNIDIINEILKTL